MKKTTIILITGLIFASIFIIGIKQASGGEKRVYKIGTCEPNPSGPCKTKCTGFYGNQDVEVWMVTGSFQNTLVRDGKERTDNNGEVIVDMKYNNGQNLPDSGAFIIRAGDYSYTNWQSVKSSAGCWGVVSPPPPPLVFLSYKVGCFEWCRQVCTKGHRGNFNIWICDEWGNQCSTYCTWGDGPVKFVRTNNESITVEFSGVVYNNSLDSSILSTNSSGFGAPTWPKQGDKSVQTFSARQTFTQDGIYVLSISGITKNNSNEGTASASDSVTVQVVSDYTLDVSKEGNGAVTSSPLGIDCGTDCSETYESGTSVTLTAYPSFDSVFAGWTGDCSGLNPNCVLTINSNKSAKAVFNIKKYSYSCNNSTWSCYEDINGQYTSLVDCASDCRKPQPLSSEFPSCTFSSKPSSIPKYSKSELIWKCDNVDSCQVQGEICSGKTGTCPVSPKITTTYTLSCSGPGGDITKTTKVTILKMQVREVRP